ncbi:hypothetical protein A2U94_19680 [Bacillus sp. VT 712]|uniref:Uncharacterized protein n=1 Tax=Priestia veravalensis TaxID=1414648 RepID=A0A0V8JAJ6_9BACI|nr:MULTISPECIES: hypothetical protein [Bacillaceae]KSU83989.1 hypothetical protein AS180_21085 [Priestia veravalensis]KZB89778.1 hypothetical protein A2U94_19680 [Bacillus sp. VT 712]SCC59737.1 hypothetical protein GA0061087_11255 [Priestia flexa]
MKYIAIGVAALIYSSILDYLSDEYGLNYFIRLILLAILVGITYKIFERVELRNKKEHTKD